MLVNTPGLKSSRTFGVIITRPDAIRRFVMEVIQQTKSDFKWMSSVNPFRRRPVYLSFEITPVVYDGVELVLPADGCGSLPVTSRDLSLKGIGFLHDAPIEGRHFVASFPALEELRLAMLVERRWSKELEPGEFLSGGRFVGVVVLRGRESEDDEETPGWSVSLEEGDLPLSIESRSRRMLDILAEHLPECVEAGAADEEECDARGQRSLHAPA